MYRHLFIDLSLLPVSDPIYKKLFYILKKRIEDRSGALCSEQDTDGAFCLSFVTDPGVPREGFRLKDIPNGIEISGRDFLSLMYGAGQFLHKSQYSPEGILPTDWRGESVPQNEKRMIFFAQHFFNWYQCCSEEEIREHIEDLILWGINGVVSVFSCLNLTGWDDPNMPNMANLFRKTLRAAREFGLKIGIEYSNIDFAVPRKELAADYKYLLSKTGNLICPSTEEGFAYYRQMLTRILELTDDLGGLDFLTIWAYDEGGCSCDKCFPWGGNGFYHMAHRISKYVRSKYPRIEIWLATWYLGRSEPQKDEWPMLYRHLQEDAAKGDNWVDYLLLETRDDYDEVYYPARHGQPTAHTKLLTFPDVSMVGMTPWGGFGAICTPELMKRWEAPFAPHCSGGYLYTEGIWDDINKAVMLGLYWDRSRSTDETLADYCRYEYPGIDPQDFIRLVKLIEASHSCTNRIDAKPSPSEYYEEAWTLAEQIHESAPEPVQSCWRWRIVYIRAYLDLVRYRRCAELGWPLLKRPRGWFFFWRKFLEHDARAQEYLLELIHLYKAQETDDTEKYAYHYYLRPPMTKGADLEAERKFSQNAMI